MIEGFPEPVRGGSAALAADWAAAAGQQNHLPGSGVSRFTVGQVAANDLEFPAVKGRDLVQVQSGASTGCSANSRR